MEWIEKNTDKILKIDYDNEIPMLPTWKNISRHPIVTMDFIEKHIDYPWDFYYVGKNPNLTLEFFEKYKNKKFYYGVGGVQNNPNFSMKWVARNVDCTWNLINVASSEKILINVLEKNKQIFIEAFKDCFGVVCNSNLTIDKFLENKDLIFEVTTFGFNFFCQTGNIKMKDIGEHRELPWNFTEISVNRNITIKFIEENIDKIDFKILSKNSFKLENRKLERLKAFMIFKKINKLSSDIKRKITQDYF